MDIHASTWCRRQLGDAVDPKPTGPSRYHPPSNPAPEATITADTPNPVSPAPDGAAEPLPTDRSRRIRPPRGRRIVPLRKLVVRLGFALGRLLPLRRQVVFAISHSFEITGNLAFIRDELDRRDPPIPYKILAHRTARTWKSWLGTFVRQAQAGFHIASNRVFIVDDYFFPLYVIKPREGTTVVQTWHASGAFKKIGWSVLDKTFGADEELVSQVAIHSNYDVCLMASRHAAVYYADAFRTPMEKFRTDLGMPRTDVLFGDEKIRRIEAEVRAKYALPEGKRVILYAPTFRGETVRRARTPENLDLRAMAEGLGDDHVLLLRLHPFVRKATPIPDDLAAFAIDVSDHPDIHELMLVSDILITDYSSAIFEFSLLERPMLFYAPDHDDYLDERGFYWDYRTGVPGPVFETTAEVVEALRAGDFDLERVRAFKAESFEVADGHASERFVDQVVLPALG
jgi:CDP-glycerol glycerophosphotransferase (TagB/SpsB family)